MRFLGYPYWKGFLRLPGSTLAPGISSLLAPVGTAFSDPNCTSDPRQLRHPQTPLGSSWTGFTSAFPLPFHTRLFLLAQQDRARVQRLPGTSHGAGLFCRGEDAAGHDYPFGVEPPPTPRTSTWAGPGRFESGPTGTYPKNLQDSALAVY